MEKQYITKSQKETMKVAAEFSKSLKSGDVILLEGDLGAGKTVFVKGVASFFGAKSESVTSPTFTIVNTYNLQQLNIYHFDFYRVSSIDELYNIGIEEYLYGNGICFVEWPERAYELFDSTVKKVKITKLDENSRSITIS